jgi:hypothetical protein
MKITRFPVIFVLVLLTILPLTAVSQDVIKEWNTIAANMTLAPPAPEPGQSPGQQLRTMAIYSAAVHDAVNGITREYETHMSPGMAPDGASAEAAAIAASYRALCGLFPSQCSNLNTMFLLSLTNHGLSPSDPGVPYGMTAAQDVLDFRATDGASVAQFPWNGPNLLPGTFRLLPTQPNALLPGWGAVTPFVLKTGSQFRPEPPPALDSELYARDYNEVKEVGGSLSACSPTNPPPCRTSEQLTIAIFWRDGSPLRIYNQPLQAVVTAAGFDISTTARTYALLYLALADSGIACWEAKYGVPGISGGYNFWRPQAAINRGDEDGNPATDPDPTWTPVIGTPIHPEYPSGHSTNGAAAMEIFQQIFGDDPGMPITSTIGPTTREWATFSQVVDEVVDARVWSGIHYRNTDEVGARLGRQVGQFVWTHALRPCKGNGTCS